MRKLFIFFLGVLVGGGLVGFGFKCHVVRTNDGLILVPKEQANFEDLYVDVRNWKTADWQAHPDFVRALLARGRRDLIGSPASNEFLRELMRKFENAQKVDDERLLE